VGRDIVNIFSATFVAGGETEHEFIRSAVEVFPSASVAARHIAVNASQRAIACLARFIPKSAARENTTHVHYGPFAVTRLPDPLPGVPGSFGIRISAAILGVASVVTPTEPHIYIDVLGFLSGPAEVDLTTTAIPEPVSEEAEHHLLSVLYSHTTAHKL
jgi:hypothetical protein